MVHPQTIRLGVVGCGAVLDRYHLPALLASRSIELTAFVDPVIDRARQYSDRVGARALVNHLDLCGAVDAALVTVPNALHALIAGDLLRAGVHVLVEKPMARTVAECDRLIAAAAETGAVLAVGHDFRHFPVAQFAAGLFRSGVLGEVRHIDVRQHAGTRWPSVSAAAILPEAGGGVLLNFGVHVLDLLLWWVGELSPMWHRDDAEGGVEAECESQFTLANGAVVRLELSRRRPMRDTAVLECELGTIELGVHDPAVVRVSCIGGGGPVLNGAVVDAEFERAPLRTVFSRQLADFVGAVQGRGTPLVSAADGRRVVALVEACYAIKEPLRRAWDYPEAYASRHTPKATA